jgi:hypothetical protein
LFSAEFRSLQEALALAWVLVGVSVRLAIRHWEGDVEQHREEQVGRIPDRHEDSPVLEAGRHHRKWILWLPWLSLEL